MNEVQYLLGCMTEELAEVSAALLEKNSNAVRADLSDVMAIEGLLADRGIRLPLSNQIVEPNMSLQYAMEAIQRINKCNRFGLNHRHATYSTSNWESASAAIVKLLVSLFEIGYRTDLRSMQLKREKTIKLMGVSVAMGIVDGNPTPMEMRDYLDVTFTDVPEDTECWIAHYGYGWYAASPATGIKYRLTEDGWKYWTEEIVNLSDRRVSSARILCDHWSGAGEIDDVVGYRDGDKTRLTFDNLYWK